MDAHRRPGLPVRDTESAILKQYYKDNMLFMSAEGVLKVLSIVLCLVSSTVQLTSGRCEGAARLVPVTAYTTLGAAAMLACLFSGAALSITNYAPTWWLFTDIVLSSVVGVTLLLTAILSLTLCHLQDAVDYLHGPLAMITSGMIVASAVVTYISVTRRWDAARRTGMLRPPPEPVEQQV